MSIILGHDPATGLDGEPVTHKEFNGVAHSIMLIGPSAERSRFRQSIIERLNPYVTRHVDFSRESAEVVKDELKEVYGMQGRNTIVLSMHGFLADSSPNEEYALFMMKRGPMFGVTAIAEFDTSSSSHAHEIAQRADIILAIGDGRDDTFRRANGYEPEHGAHDAHLYQNGTWRPILLDWHLTHSPAERVVE